MLHSIRAHTKDAFNYLPCRPSPCSGEKLRKEGISCDWILFCLPFPAAPTYGKAHHFAVPLSYVLKQSIYNQMCSRERIAVLFSSPWFWLYREPEKNQPFWGPISLPQWTFSIKQLPYSLSRVFGTNPLTMCCVSYAQAVEVLCKKLLSIWPHI